MATTWASSLLIILVITTIAPPCKGFSPISLLRQLIQENLAGRPENFKVVSWKFDPDISERRSVEFQEKYGVHGERLIERLGLGDDGYLEERKQQQIIREQEIDPRHNENIKTR
ncbi:hypothetical protein L9F63_004245 [Diploptera punctata]|uniref:Uncharacterized protein n=1 Tax=Diploptera punctata TaxID=6984 RepID=A0AAD7ZHQ0_DIPPU|nr:hypothetical protein L9F63_004245 [Diploptera punctata]